MLNNSHSLPDDKPASRIQAGTVDFNQILKMVQMYDKSLSIRQTRPSSGTERRHTGFTPNTTLLTRWKAALPIMANRTAAIILLLIGLWTTAANANNNEPPNPIDHIKNYVKHSDKPVTAYNIAEHIEGLMATSFGTATQFNTGVTGGNDAISIKALSASTFVVAYKDLGNGGDGTAIIGTVSGTSLTFGSESVFNVSGSAATERISVVPLSTTSFVVTYENFNSAYGSSNGGATKVGTVSGTGAGATISFGAEVLFESGRVPSVFATALSATTFVVAYQDRSNSYYGTAVVGTVSGTAITYGSEYVYNAAFTGAISITALSATAFVVAYNDDGNSGHGTAIVGTVSGTTITYGSEYVYKTAQITQFSGVTTAMNSTQFVVVYQETNTLAGRAIIGTVSGTGAGASIAYSTEETINATGLNIVTTALRSDIIGPPTTNATHYATAYRDFSNGYAKVGDATADVISGSTCSDPTTLTATNITTTTADLGWTAGGSETDWQYVVQAAGGAAPTAGTPTSSNPTTVTGLTTGTAYEFYVRADCGSSTYSAWVGPFAFSTINNALDFDGVNDYVNCGVIGQTTPLMTLEVWINPATVISGLEPIEIISRWGAGGVGNASYRLGINSSGKAVFQVFSGFGASGVTSTATIPVNTWTHLTAVRDANANLLIYINGVLDNSVANSVVPQVSNYQVNLGAAVVGNPSSPGYYKGLMDEVRIWNVAFNATNVADYYDKTFSNPADAASYLLAYYKLDETTGSTAPDVSGNGNTGTLTNMANDDWVASTTGVTSSLVPDLSVLPVELTYFTAEATENGNLLTWATATEENNAGFEIQQSTDARNFEKISFVVGNGTTYEQQTYEFLDKNTNEGVTYYRLKQMDFDGQFEYSDVVAIANNGLDAKAILVYPNPVQDELTITESVGMITIYNALGQPVKQIINENQTIFAIDVRDLPKGIYSLQLRKANGKVVTTQFVK